MALEIFWSKKADKSFDTIIEYLENNWGENSVKQFTQKTFDFLNILSEYSEIGSLEYKRLNIRAFVLVEQITLFYQLKKSKIILLNFYDNRQNPKIKKY